MNKLQDRLQHRLEDKHGRVIRKLRISLLDTCQMRCLYCMPEEAEFMPKKNWLAPHEIFEITRNLVDLGIEEIRLTGGEPLLREDFAKIISLLSDLPLKKLALTTNGLRLLENLDHIQSTKLNSINVSLDSFKPETFFQITRHHSLNKVIDGILKAKEKGLQIKINTVLLKGINDSEIQDFLLFSKKYNIPVRFLEAMKIGVMRERYSQYFISVDEIIQKLKLSTELNPITSALDSTSFNFRTNDEAEIGFIASESRPFCGQCSRLRMGPDGMIYPCLFVDEGIPLKGVPRDQYSQILSGLLDRKPLQRIPELEKAMYAIGG